MSQEAVQRIGIVGLGHYGSALAMGLLRSGISSGPTAVRGLALYDVDATKMAQFADKGPLVHVCASAAELAARSHAIFLAVPATSLRNVTTELAGAMQAGGVHKRIALLFMDTMDASALSSLPGNVAYGRVMFNYAVRYSAGIVAIWPGNLNPQTVLALKSALSSLGHVWDVDCGDDLLTVRATAGAGIGMLAHILESMERTFKDVGLEPDQARQAILSVVRGVDEHVKNGGSIAELLRLCRSQGRSMTGEILAAEATERLDQAIRSAVTEGLRRFRDA